MNQTIKNAKLAARSLELREAGRCPECFQYLGKNEKDLTVDWCSNCLVSYPDNLKQGAPTMEINPRYLAGRCANGAERDGGTLFHAVPAESWKALCGAQPGRRSAGWGTPWNDEQPVTCPRCLRRMQPTQTQTLAQQRKAAIRAARVQLLTNGNPLTIKGAELVLDEMARVEPDLVAAQWFKNASNAQWNLFKKEWNRAIEWKRAN